jgi:trk system potassium uptake protein TrkH
MNFPVLAKYLAGFAAIMGVFMLPAVGWAIWFGEGAALAAFAKSIVVSLLVGGALALAGRRSDNRFSQREALGLVGISWLIAAALGGLPYWFVGTFGPVDAFFESMSGLTTTGATVLTDFDGTPRSIMFWRSFTQWLGGMGIIVLFIAVLPYLGAGGKQLFRSESPGPDPRGLQPRIKDTASVLYKIYLALTVLQTAALMAAGMNFYEALCHTCSTLSTGGFSTRAESIAAFDSVLIEGIIIFFIILAGTNFSLYFLLLRRDWFAPFRDTEWRMYMVVLGIATLLITVNVMGIHGEFAPDKGDETELTYDSFGTALRAAAFQVVAIMTGTGFGTEDFDQWPHFSRMLLVALMFVGGCAGSTAGGMKVVRIIMLFKMAYWRLEATFRPKTVRAIRISGTVVEEDMQKTVNGFFFLYLLWFALGILVMSALDMPFTSATTSVIATLNNIGPGLEAVGPLSNYSEIHPFGKLFLSLSMLIGRLELFAICVMFVPAFWKHS